MTAPKPPGDPARPGLGGSHWCVEHQRYECTRQRSKGRGQCHGTAIEGTAACRMHIGVSLDVAKAQGQARITAFSALGAIPSVDPGLAVLASLHMSWLRVHLYASLLEDQVGDEADQPVGGWGDEVEPGGVARQSSPAGTAGLIGHVYSADKMAGIFASGEARRALVDLEAQERDRCVRFAKVAHDMGIAEREVRLAEQQGELMATVIRNVLGDLALTPDQQALAPAAIQTHLRAAAMAEIEGGAA